MLSHVSAGAGSACTMPTDRYMCCECCRFAGQVDFGSRLTAQAGRNFATWLHMKQLSGARAR